VNLYGNKSVGPPPATPGEDELPILPDPLRPAPPVPARDFQSVYAEHFDFACRSLRLLGVSADAIEDAAQDVFGVVSRRLGELTVEGSVRTWVFAIVQRVAANHRRTQRRKQAPLEPLSPAERASDPSPEARAEAAQAASLVQSFCDALDDGRRALFVLALIEDVPAREIAPLLGIPLFTVYSRIRSLRQQLQRFLEPYELKV